MPVFALIGTAEDEKDLIKGNGKTILMVFFGALAFTSGKKILSNVKTSFSEYMKIEDMILYLTREIARCESENINITTSEIYGIVILLDEIDKYLNSLGGSPVIINFVDRLVSQIRKIDGTIYMTAQRWGNVHRRMRIQTDQILKPKKIHYAPPEGDGKFCPLDNCLEPHAILGYSWYPHTEKPLVTIDCEIVGKWYDTRQFIPDLPNVKKIKEMLANG